MFMRKQKNFRQIRSCVCSLMDKNSGLLIRKMRVRLPSDAPNYAGLE